MKKILSLIMLLVAIVTGAWADVTVGLTQDYTSNTGEKTWTDATNIILTQQIGSNTLNYSKGDKDDVYLDGQKIADKGESNYKGCWRAANAEYADSYLGYDLTISSGYALNITSFYARVLSISNATLTWKLQILSNADAVLYESAEQTLQRTSNPTPKVEIGVASLSEEDQAKFQNISGGVKVRLWVKCASGQSTKYYGVDNLTITGSVEEDARTSYTITANVADGQSSYGTVSGGGSVVEGESTVLTATANEGYAFIKWTKDDADYSTDASITLTNVTTDATYVANFKQVYQVAWQSTYKGDYTKSLSKYDATYGVNEKWADVNDKFVIPTYADKCFYREGYVFTKWKINGDSSTNRYDSGDEITVTDGTISSNKVTLIPVFTATTQALDKSATPTTVTWNFAKSNNVFYDWQSGDGKYEYFTETATVNGEKIAVPMKITAGKLANYSRTDDLAQTNQNTKFTIPAVKGMVVTIANAYKEFSTTTIAGSKDYTGTGTKSISYTYTDEESTIDIVIGESNQYLRTIQVVYPAATETVTTNAGKWASYTPSFNVTLEDGAEAYYITSIGAGGQLDGEAVTTLKAGEGYFVKGAEASHTYTATYSTADADATDGNMLIGCTESTTLAAGYTPYRYFLGTDSSTGKAGLFYVGSTAITIPAGKSYLQTEAATPLALSLPFEETTAVEAVAEAKAENAAPVKVIKNGKLYIGNYNVAGQQVK